jgi:hypothetical protein
MGEVFAGRYELADPIGRGGVGAVWRAWDHSRRRPAHDRSNDLQVTGNPKPWGNVKIVEPLELMFRVWPHVSSRGKIKILL